ncbi:MAG: LLM class flavin-dependent oxidoreductase [Anaerolineae bacterium]|nr:LLM class flavin-dependent oxidoreductase [Anaerolineae bacterium]
MPTDFDIGIMFRCQNPPEQLVTFVQQVETAGFDEVWIVEDCFFAGGIASVATALSHTESITVGLGILPAVVRNAAFVAMELSALLRLFPGRFLPGFGHGVGVWMKQAGAFPPSQLAALEEVTTVVRRLLAGETVTFNGQTVNLDAVKLDFPPAEVPIISLGVRGPKSLQLAGRVTKGTLLAEFASPEYVAWAREQIKLGQEAASKANEPHRLTVYAFCVVDEDREAAFAKVRPSIAGAIANRHMDFYLEPLGLLDAANKLAEGGREYVERHLPDEWISKLAVVGTPQECKASIEALADAGADSIVLVPLEPDDRALQTYMQLLLPLFD